ncbi:flagellar hook capping FlgD N-terminal domain-containing protein [Amaricoccus macauensis]|uniref:flagellar hook capping FlgD N-terminal domain-containing protein n=1 Tax=Amaricoccus macauensis TaxID=57001 RepID=UPI003C7C3109
MDVNSTSAASTSTTSQSSASAASASESAAANALTGDFNTFIQLLTAQMNNQDPLEPTSNTEFVAQLASFSAVEQQILTNDTLSALSEKLGVGQAGEVAAWIGKEVLVEGGYAQYSGTPVEVEVDAVDGAHSAVLVVRDATGTIVARQAANGGATTLTWDGTRSSGTAADHGLYSFQLESSATDGTVISTQRGKVFSAIDEVRLTEDGASLIASGGVTVAANDVTAIR